MLTTVEKNPFGPSKGRVVRQKVHQTTNNDMVGELADFDAGFYPR
jgi:hypothetical protein